MKREIVRRIDIHASPDRVWQVMSDVERWPEWTASISRVRLYTGSPLEVGSRAIVKQPRFPAAQWLVTEVEQDRGFVWVSIGPGLTVTARHEIEPMAEGSRVTLSLEYAGILSGLLLWLTRGITVRYVDLEAEGLKRRAER
jgi:uncharacterized membrane protein